MSTIPFDTLKFTKRLEAAGMSSEHAEAIAEAFGEATGSELVTKDFLRGELQALRADFAASKYDLIKWMAGLLLAQAGLVTALVKLL